MRYVGWRIPNNGTIAAGKCVVKVDGAYLDPRHEIVNHSPDGFEWGYGGSGPAQLAFAMLFCHFSDHVKAFHYYQAFKWMVISQLPDRWILTGDEIAGFIEAIDAEAAVLKGGSHGRPDHHDGPGGGGGEEGGVSSGGEGGRVSEHARGEASKGTRRRGR